MPTKEKIIELVMTALAALWLHVSPLILPFVVIGILDAIDFYTGVRASRKQGKVFTRSDAMSRTHDKLVWQGASLLVFHLLGIYVVKGIPVLQAMMFAIIWIEVQSVREKVKILSGKDIFKEPFNMIKRIKK